MDDFEELLQLDEQKIRDSVRLQLPVEVTTYTLSRNMEVYIHKVLRAFLQECHQEQMAEYLVFCLGELLTNAKKANTKRVFFQEQGLDINNPEDYEKGMKDFKEKTLTNINHYLELQKKQGLYIKLCLQFKGDKVIIEIKNNSVITPKELERVHNKLESVHRYHSLEEVYSKVLDSSEGAGLGIIIISLMLQKIGYSKDSYTVRATDKETITSIVLPCNAVVYDVMEVLGYDFVCLQQGIPVFKDSMEEAEAIVCGGEYEIDRQKLLEKICSDVTLYLLLLKNLKKQKTKESFNIIKALNEFSDRELQEIYSVENTDVDFIQKNDERKRLWRHSANVGFFAYNLLANKKDQLLKFTPEEFYGFGLLANIGYILVRCASEFQKQIIQDSSDQYEESDKIKDNFYAGNSAGYIAMRYITQLGFSSDAVALLSCWNNKEFVPDFPKEYLDILYLAEMFQNYDEKRMEFYQFDKEILKSFGITNEEQLKNLISELISKSPA